jgi:hypothetical protein
MKIKNMDIVNILLKSKEPSIRYKVLVNVLGEDPRSTKILKLQNQIRSSTRIGTLLSQRDGSGKIPFRPYAKWYGAHWVLTDLAELGYPPYDKSLFPLRDQIYDWLFSLEHEAKIISINGKVRRCASQEGNALLYLLKLGLDDERTQELAKRLSSWQWPDGGWNCDKNPNAQNSSFMESLIPLRALAFHTKLTKDKKSEKATKSAAEIFLKRECFKKQRDGNIISEDFIRLHYPCYWHYDILFGLKVLAEAGFIKDKRCSSALDLLESKRLADGGFPAEKKYYRLANDRVSGRSLVNWGGISKRHMNEFITVDVLFVLSKAGRLD